MVEQIQQMIIEGVLAPGTRPNERLRCEKLAAVREHSMMIDALGTRDGARMASILEGHLFAKGPLSAMGLMVVGAVCAFAVKPEQRF